MLSLFFKLLKASFATDKVFSTLNILGLSVGICSSLLIYLWVANEMSYNKCYNNANKIYRLIEVKSIANGEKKSALTPAPLAFELKNNFPQIIKAASIYGDNTRYSILYNNHIAKFNIRYTSNDFFDLFNFPVSYKAGKSFFINDHSAVISGSCAKKLFGNENPLGKQIEDSFEGKIYEISAVVDIPKNSTLHFEILVPFGANKTINRIRHQWNIIDDVNYIQIADNVRFDEQQKERLRDFLSEKLNTNSKLYFQPFLDIHLFTDFNDNYAYNNGNIRYVRTLSTVALFLLIIASLNYIILLTARSEKRNKEIALKKLFGLNKYQLIYRFLLETMIFTIIAQLLSVILFLLIKPYLNEFTGKSINLQVNITTLLYFIGSAFIISLLAGSYLSFYLSSLKPVNLLQGITKKGGQYHISTIITPAQLFISLIFIICSISIYQQLKYMQNKDTGMQIENIMAVDTQGFIYKFEVIKHELLRNPNIYSITATGGIPINYHFAKKGINWEGKNTNEQVAFNIFTVDPSFLKTFNIKLLQGTFFPQDMNLNDYFNGRYEFKTPIVINEAALSFMGIDNPIGKKIDLGTPQMDGYITGVVSNFNFKPLNYKVSPLAIVYCPESFTEMYIKINPKKKKEIISYVEKVTKPYRKGKYLFDYYFVKEKQEHLYKAEKNMSSFAFISVLISVSLSFLGILGMISYSILRRRKSIAIRKVYGAKMVNIMYMYIKQSVVIMSIAFLMAVPVAWYYLHGWLENYAYHIYLSPFLFIQVFMIALLVIIIITVVLVYSEANKNPVENLKYE